MSFARTRCKRFGIKGLCSWVRLNIQGFFVASSVLQCQNPKSLLMPLKQRPGDLLSGTVWLKVYWNLQRRFLHLLMLAPKILLFWICLGSCELFCTTDGPSESVGFLFHLNKCFRLRSHYLNGRNKEGEHLGISLKIWSVLWKKRQNASANYCQMTVRWYDLRRWNSLGITVIEGERGGNRPSRFRITSVSSDSFWTRNCLTGQGCMFCNIVPDCTVRWLSILSSKNAAFPLPSPRLSL